MGRQPNWVGLGPRPATVGSKRQTLPRAQLHQTLIILPPHPLLTLSLAPLPSSPTPPPLSCIASGRAPSPFSYHSLTLVDSQLNSNLRPPPPPTPTPTPTPTPRPVKSIQTRKKRERSLARVPDGRAQKLLEPQALLWAAGNGG